MPELVGVPGPDVERLRSLLCPHFEAMAAASHRRFTVDSIFAALARGDMQLWIAIDGVNIVAAGITELIRYPNHTACRAVALIGRDHRAWLRKLSDAVDAWARAQGCTEMQALVGQRGWERLLRFLGYRPDHVLLSKDL